MSFVVSGFVDQISQSFVCKAVNGMALLIPARAKILTSGIIIDEMKTAGERTAIADMSSKVVCCVGGACGAAGGGAALMAGRV